jgi:hypothetical protein
MSLLFNINNQLPDGGRRLHETILAWERDPNRAQQLAWQGLDNDDTDEENNEILDEVIVDDDDDEQVEPSQFPGENIDEFVVDDNDVEALQEYGRPLHDEEVAPQPAAVAAAAPAPQVVRIAGVTLPYATASDSVQVPDGEQACIVCTQLPCTVVIVPCGHSNVCLPCLYNLFQAAAATNHVSATCPTCRAQVAQVIRLYRN